VAKATKADKIVLLRPFMMGRNRKGKREVKQVRNDPWS
jgi:hypothetical protein